MRKILAIAAISALLITSAFALAQELPGGKPSEWVKITADEDTIPADGVSVAMIEVMITWPNTTSDTELIGEPAANQTVTMWTTLGLLTDTMDENNTGQEINLTTDDDGIATALLSSNETGNATVYVLCKSGGWNSTHVNFVTPEDSSSTTPPLPHEILPQETTTTSPTPTQTGATPTTATPVSTPSEPEATPTATPVSTPSESEAPATATPTPGFGVALTAIAGLSVVIAYLRRNKEE